MERTLKRKKKKMRNSMYEMMRRSQIPAFKKRMIPKKYDKKAF